MPKSFIPETYRPNEAYLPYWGGQNLYKVDAVCSDGIVRRATLAMESDTHFSRPASVKVRGKSVSGFITADDTYGDPDAVTVYRFLHYTYGKNAGMLPDNKFTH